MYGALLIYLGFDLGWRGYGLRPHAYVCLAFIFVMSAFTLYRTPEVGVGALTSYASMALLLELFFMLPGWALGRGARGRFGGGKPYSLKMSFDV